MKPIPNQHAIDEIILDNVEIVFRPTWNGSAWVLDPATIDIVCDTILGASGNEVEHATHIFKADTLPGAAQTALNDMYDFLESKIQAKYP